MLKENHGKPWKFFTSTMEKFPCFQTMKKKQRCHGDIIDVLQSMLYIELCPDNKLKM